MLLAVAMFTATGALLGDGVAAGLPPQAATVKVTQAKAAAVRFLVTDSLLVTVFGTDRRLILCLSTRNRQVDIW
jgi:hypothetical protein